MLDFFFFLIYSQCNKKQTDDGAGSQQEGDEVNGQVMAVYSIDLQNQSSLGSPNTHVSIPSGE